MIRTLLISASVGVALAVAFTAAWQPMRSAVASSEVGAGGPQADGIASRPIENDDLFGVPNDRHSQAREITPELIERVIEVARQVDRPMAQRLRALCDEHPPQEIERYLRTAGRRLVALADLKSRDPDLYQIKINELQSEAHISVLAAQIAEARLTGDEAREKALRDEIVGPMRVHVGMTLAARTQYIKRLEEHLAALKAELDRDAHYFEQTVERKIAEAIDNALRESEGSVAQRR